MATKSNKTLRGPDRYLRGGALQDHLREPGGERLHVGSTEKYRENYDRIFGDQERQCGKLFDFNLGRLRCTRPEGHDGLHSVFNPDGSITPTQEKETE